MASIIDKRLSLHHRLAKKEQENSALKSQNLQLQALASLGSATSMIAHEINNLLTPLANYAALAVQNPDDRELAAKALDKTVRNCQRAARIMGSMLTMANGRKQQTSKANILAMVEEVFTCLCRDLGKDGITVRVQVPQDLELTCVPVQIQQVLMNLILNARDAMLPAGGILTIAASAADEHVELAVSDTGKGIAPEDIERVFQPFFTTKTEADRPAQGSGSGVGLAFCQRVAEAHAGRISVTSRLGEGTTFRLRLPKSRPEHR
ncbi:MAG: HAMP domain-containing histidine kinase [Sedimentisphaerales bacterium]|nr:HAMP domain-containing histidine kinase [Sedimentisphaerales bacterium]